MRQVVKPILLLIAISLVTPATVRAEEDPEIRGRKVSEWFKFIRQDKDARRRMAALLLVDGEAGVKVPVLFPSLTKELRENPDPAIRVKTASLLPKYKERGDEVTVALKIALADDKDGPVREAAAMALGQLDQAGFRAVAELTTALKDQHVGTRAAAAEAIGRFSRLDPEIARDAMTTLAAILRDADRGVRQHAAFALGRMGPGAGEVANELGAALTAEKDLAVRKELIKALGALGPKAGAAPANLLAGLRDPNAEIRQLSALALAKVPLDATAALPELLKAASDPDRSVRCYAIHAIGSLGKGAVSAIPELIAILSKDNVAEVRLAVIEELARFGPDAKAALEVLTVASRDGRPAVREAAQEALKRIQSMP